MGNISNGVMGDTNTFNLKALKKEEIRSEVFDLLVNGETVEQSFSTMRDQVIFTNKRILVVNVQGLIGKKISYFSYPFSKVQYFGIETAGVLDIDSELVLHFNDGSSLQFDFKSNVNIQAICASIAEFIL